MIRFRGLGRPRPALVYGGQLQLRSADRALLLRLVRTDCNDHLPLSFPHQVSGRFATGCGWFDGRAGTEFRRRSACLYTRRAAATRRRQKRRRRRRRRLRLRPRPRLCLCLCLLAPRSARYLGRTRARLSTSLFLSA